MFFHAPSTRIAQEDEALFIMQGNTFPHQPPSFPSQVDFFYYALLLFAARVIQPPRRFCKE